MFLASREVYLVLKRYAGHSKWQNIRHTKALKDTQRSQLYSQLGQRMKVAIQGGLVSRDQLLKTHLYKVYYFLI